LRRGCSTPVEVDLGINARERQPATAAECCIGEVQPVNAFVLAAPQVAGCR